MINWLCFLAALSTLLVAQDKPLPAPEHRQPVYIVISGDFSDHINLDTTEDGIARYLDQARDLRRDHPEYQASILLEFSGNVSEALDTRSRAHNLVARIRAGQVEGTVEVGYDGSEEPTYLTRPRPDFRQAATPEARWVARTRALRLFLTEHKQEIYGEPDPARSGGLKRTEEVFGRVSSIRGIVEELGGDAECVAELFATHPPTLMPGVPLSHTYPARTIHGYTGAAAALAEELSPAPDCPPELFWQDATLRFSDMTAAVHVVAAFEGPEALKQVVEKLDRTRTHVIRVKVGDPGIYFKKGWDPCATTPLRYAYDHPKAARVPESARYSTDEVKAALLKEAAALNWLTRDFFPANPGSRFLSVSAMVSGALGRSMKDADDKLLGRLAEVLLLRFKEIGNHPPGYVQAGGHYFSLAESFQLLCEGLAYVDRTGSRPPTVGLYRCHGPIELLESQGPSLGTVTVAQIREAARHVAERLHSPPSEGVPNNIVPVTVHVGSVELNAAQFLRLMAEAYPASDGGQELTVRTCQMGTSVTGVLPSTRRFKEMGASWTFKPAALSVPPPAPPLTGNEGKIREGSLQ